MKNKYLIAAGILSVLAVSLVTFAPHDLQSILGWISSGLFGLVGVSLIKDASLRNTLALPNGAATVTSTGIDLETSSLANNLGLELLLTAPALTNGQLGNAATMTYSIEHDTDSAFGTATSLYGTVLTQTGNGTGAAAATKRVALPADCKRYVRLKAVNSAAGNASAASATLEVMGK